MMFGLIFLSFTYSYILFCTCRPTSNNLFSPSHTPQYIEREGLYCEIISCNETDKYVKSCEKNGTTDTCEPCPTGTEMKDFATSRVKNFKCVRKKRCPPETRPVNYTTICPSIQDYRISCECDRGRGFCGVDPCGCRRKTCPVGLYLEQNCGCSFIKELKSIRLTTPLRLSTSTESINFTQSTTVSQELVPWSSTNSVEPSVDQFTTTHLHLGEVEKDTDDNNTTLIAVVIVAGMVVTAVVIIYSIRHFRSSVTYNAKFMQFGNNSTFNNNVSTDGNESESESN